MAFSIGEKLKKLRIERYLTQDEIAYMTNTTRQQISRYEKDKQLPSYDVLVKLAEYYHVTVDYLLGINTELLYLSGLYPREIKVIEELISILNNKNKLISDINERKT